MSPASTSACGCHVYGLGVCKWQKELLKGRTGSVASEANLRFSRFYHTGKEFSPKRLSDLMWVLLEAV